MCGHIKKLRFPDRLATQDEIDAAVQQFLRKIANVRRPSENHRPAFERAATAIAQDLREMLGSMRSRRANAVAMACFKPFEERSPASSATLPAP